LRESALDDLDDRRAALRREYGPEAKGLYEQRPLCL
jgi:hypothetical protein